MSEHKIIFYFWCSLIKLIEKYLSHQISELEGTSEVAIQSNSYLKNLLYNEVDKCSLRFYTKTSEEVHTTIKKKITSTSSWVLLRDIRTGIESLSLGTWTHPSQLDTPNHHTISLAQVSMLHSASRFPLEEKMETKKLSSSSFSPLAMRVFPLFMEP